jgi:hypothetical protein
MKHPDVCKLLKRYGLPIEEVPNDECAHRELFVYKAAATYRYNWHLHLNKVYSSAVFVLDAVRHLYWAVDKYQNLINASAYWRAHTNTANAYIELGALHDYNRDRICDRVFIHIHKHVKRVYTSARESGVFTVSTGFSRREGRPYIEIVEGAGRPRLLGTIHPTLTKQFFDDCRKDPAYFGVLLDCMEDLGLLEGRLWNI